MAQGWKEETVDNMGAALDLFKGGSGPPLLVLHGAGGNPGWLGYHHALSRHFTVYAPSHPGFNGSEALPWIDSIPAVAHYYLGLLEDLGLNHVALLGFSMGAWIAAEMVAMCSHNVKRMVLVSAVGIKPHKGEIAELFNVPRSEVEKLRFYDEAQVPGYAELYGRESTPEEKTLERHNREMAARLCWKPYMYNPNLPEYLRKVNLPTLLVWGRQDAIVPLECGEQLEEILPNSSLHVIDQCGHSPQVEKPHEFLDAVMPFLVSS